MCSTIEVVRTKPLVFEYLSTFCMLGRGSHSKRVRSCDERIRNDVEWSRKRIVNFLAHLLTGDSGDSMLVGSFAGDFCRGRIERHHPELRAGIRLHRMVDGFAERHPSFSVVRARLRPSLGLYAPVGADMLIDHVLARDWKRWVERETLEEFAGRTGGVLLDSDLLPERGARVARWMVQGRWLESYATLGGVETALERMSRRARRGVRLAEAVQEFEQDRHVMSSSIVGFLNDLFSSRKMEEAGMADYLGPAS